VDYEYKTIGPVGFSKIQEELEKHAVEGWRLHTAVWPGLAAASVVLIFERPKSQ
jgi:hypothetical protein